MAVWKDLVYGDREGVVGLKMRRGLVILGLAAALTAGGAATVYGAGWQQTSNGAWEYYSASGNRETDVWRKGGDGLWRYVDGGGYMAVNEWIDDTYYVDGNGIMVSGTWKQMESASSYHNGTVWYYFNNDGKRVEETWKKINNKWYYFDEDGVMLTGWLLDDMYYTDANGAMVTGWQRLAPPEDSYDEDDYYGDAKNEPVENQNEDGKYWYYFGTNGKKVIPDDMNGSDYQERKINGAYYCFDANGQMQTGWCNVKGDESIDSYKYYDENGQAVVNTWLSLEAPEEFDEYGEVQWYYFSSNGTPKKGPESGQAAARDLVRIKGLTFLFNDKGNPVYGLQKVSANNDVDDYTAYYFGTDKMHCAMLTGKQEVEEGDGFVAEYFFLDSGKGYTGVRDGKLYYMGKLQVADSGIKYMPITLTTGSSSKNYLVNSNGRTVKNTTVRDAEGTKYKTGSNGIILKVNDEDVGGETFNSPIEPVWWVQ